MSYTLRQRKQLSQQWEDQILDQANSGLSIPTYCREKGIAIWKFRYWKQKLRGGRELIESGNFIPVKARTSVFNQASRLILSPTMILETAGLPDPAWLSELMEKSSQGGLSC